MCHAANVPLIVDEAHGAHYLPLAAPHGWQGGAIAAGADVIIQSPHKTLPSLTQTALLHWNSSFIPPQELERQLDVFETSSPSYPLMASLDGCTGCWPNTAMPGFPRGAPACSGSAALCALCAACAMLCCGADGLTAHPGFFAHDSGKILLSNGAAAGCGPYLAELLRRDWQFETEMSCGANVLAMTSAPAMKKPPTRWNGWPMCCTPGTKRWPPPAAPRHILPAPGAARCTIAEALLRPARAVRMRDAVGETAAEYLWAYPPGVPLVAPGEEVTAELVTACRALEQAGTALKHTGGSGAEEIAVL